MRKIFIFLLVLMMVHCRERYDVPFPSPATGYLVVEGFINPAGSTVIKLSRSTKLADRGIVQETGSVLQVQGEDNSLFPLSESAGGTYNTADLQLNPAIRYRLHILTSTNKEYASSYKLPLITPLIDSITWLRQNGGLDIFVNAHDANNNIQYYKWDYDESWEFHSKYHSNTIFQTHSTDNVIDQVIAVLYDSGKNNESIYKCWQFRKSSLINIASTASLSADVVYVPLLRYPDASWELSFLYSINLKQYALSKEGYEFYRKLKKNTESLGSIFDVQPSEIKGNITCVTDPGEQVIGYVEVSTVNEKRKYISNDELPGWNYNQGCEPAKVYLNIPATAYKLYVEGYHPFGGTTANDGSIIAFSVTKAECVKCTLRGTNIKPSYWP